MSVAWEAQVEGRRSMGGRWGWKGGEVKPSHCLIGTHTKEHFGMGQPLWMVDLDEVDKTLETAHLRALSGAVSVSKEGVPYRGAVRTSERPQLAVVWVSNSNVLVLYPQE